MIYLDNAATTPVARPVVEAMLPYFTQDYGNPGSPHRPGRKAQQALEDARQGIAQHLQCAPQELLFTSSGTESCNLAIQGVAHAKGKGHLITTSVEHHCVLETCKALEQEGFTVTYLPVDVYGCVDTVALREAITDDTILVSIIHTNNEIGTINDIPALTKIAHERGVLFHTDACQAGGKVRPHDLGVDLLTLNSSKLYGPKGAGLLFRRKDVPLRPMLRGGDHEYGLRAGTPNIPALVGFAKAIELAQSHKDLTALRDQMITGLLDIPRTFLNGHPEQRSPANVSITFSDIEGPALLEAMDREDIYASMGSACTTQQLNPSHVITAIGVPAALAHGTVRFTLGQGTTTEDINHTVAVVTKLVQELRERTPVHVDDRILQERTNALIPC